MLRFVMWLVSFLIVGPKRKTSKPSMTLPMVIAKAHNLSVQFAGLQMAAAYLAAVSLSCISVVVGMCHQIVVSQSSWPAYLSYPLGIVVGGIAAFIFDGLTISSLKRMKTVPFGWNTITAFNLFFVIGGITFSTLAGDQMWQLIIPSLSTVFAVGVSAVLVATEMWPKQHEQAVKTSTARGDVLTFALSEESDEHIENLSRDNRISLLSSPQFQNELNAETSDVVKQILIEKYKTQITPLATPKTEIVESDLQQLDQPQPMKLLPEFVQPSEPKTVQQDVQIKAVNLAQVAHIKSPKIDQALAPNLDDQTPEFVRNLSINDEQNDTSEQPHSVPTLNEKQQATLKLWQNITSGAAPENEQESVKSEQSETVPSENTNTHISEEEIDTQELPECEPTCEQNTDPLPELTENILETTAQPESEQKKPRERTAKRTTKVAGLDPLMVKKILKAEQKLIKAGQKPTKTAIGEMLGVRRQLVAQYQKAMSTEEA